MEVEHYIDPEAMRIMRAYPEVYGPGPWPVQKTQLGWGFCCDKGWYPLIERLSADIASIVREVQLPQFCAKQLKEKFGGLRFYVAGSNARILAKIAEAENEAATTCEGCGASSAGIRTINAWLTTRCDACAEQFRN